MKSHGDGGLGQAEGFTIEYIVGGSRQGISKMCYGAMVEDGQDESKGKVPGD